MKRGTMTFIAARFTAATFTVALACALFVSLPMSGADAQSYPNKPVRMLVGFAPAGPADIIARVVADKLAEAWGQPVVVENITGAGATIAGERAAKAPPDGYTLLMASNAQIVIAPSLYPNLSYDPVTDLLPVSEAVFTPNLLAINNDVPAKTVQELVAYARAQPGKLTYGSAGAGTTQHLSAELFKAMAKVEIQHVPYRGAAPVITDMLGGRLTMFFGNIAPLVPMVREGKLRGLAVTSAQRFPAASDLPTMAESGFPGFEAVASFGLVVPKGTPQAIIDKIYQDQKQALSAPDLRRRLADIGMEVVANTPAEWTAGLQAELPRWSKLIKDAGIKAGD
jgi:tripartite-type tricarboxylate transporter receptor subunit TctC